jgi:uncharacterized protein HemX
MSAQVINKHGNGNGNGNGNHNWGQHISHNLRVMLSLMIILILAATGYGFWQQNASKQLNSLSNEYHLSASLHYLEAISHLKDIKQQILSPATQNAKTHSLQKNESFSLSDTLHIAHREIQFGLELQSQFNDSSLSSSSIRLDQYSRELIASVQNAGSFTGNGINLFQDNLGRTLETLD